MKALFIFAHPDDETFGSGGTIAKLVKGGVIINVITATTGQAGQTGEYGKISADELGKIRKKEQAKAAKILGITNTYYLGLKDGQLYKHKITKLSHSLLPLLKSENPDIVVTFDKHGASNHPDHKRMSYATTHAFKSYMKTSKKPVRLYHTAVPKSYLLEYEKVGLTMTAFGKAKGTPGTKITNIVDIADVFHIKDKAARCYLSQKKDWERVLKRMKHVDLKKEFFKLISANNLF